MNELVLRRQNDIVCQFDYDVTISIGNLNFKEEFIDGFKVDHDNAGKEDQFDRRWRDTSDIKWDNSVKKADRLDYELAVASGIITSLLDTFLITEDFFQTVKNSDHKYTFIVKLAALYGFKGDSPKDAGLFLANRVYKGRKNKNPDREERVFSIITTKTGLLGLVLEIIEQFLGEAITLNSDGNFIFEKCEEDYRLGKSSAEKIAYALIYWLVHNASHVFTKTIDEFDKDGIPAKIVSLIKTFASCELFNLKFQESFSEIAIANHIIDKLNNSNVLNSTHSFNWTRLTNAMKYAGKMILPVLLNDCLVRLFYFLRRFILAVKANHITSVDELKKMDISAYLPVNNIIVVRMITVSSGVYSVINTAHSAVVRFGGMNHKTRGSIGKSFALNINLVGLGRFIIACGIDAKMSFSEACNSFRRSYGDETKDTFNALEGLGALWLDYEQVKILYSLEYQMLMYDIGKTKKAEEVRLKTTWADRWKIDTLESLKSLKRSTMPELMEEDEIFEECRKLVYEKNNAAWLYNVALEAVVFEKYGIYSGKSDALIEGETVDRQEKSNEKDVKKRNRLKVSNKYLDDVFCYKQTVIAPESLKSLRKSYDSSEDLISGTTMHRLASVIGTTVVVAATGGIAFIYAPVIAPGLASVLFGNTVAGLHGAALINASLAAFGGGSLAAGGFGMAGGTAVIAGGGALLGAAGGTGISALTSLSLLSNDELTLQECSKLYTVSKEVFIKRYNDKATVAILHDQVADRIYEMEEIEEKINEQLQVSTGDVQKSLKQDLKRAEKSIQYLKKLKLELGKLGR